MAVEGGTKKVASCDALFLAIFVLGGSDKLNSLMNKKISHVDKLFLTFDGI